MDQLLVVLATVIVGLLGLLVFLRLTAKPKDNGNKTKVKSTTKEKDKGKKKHLDIPGPPPPTGDYGHMDLMAQAGGLVPFITKIHEDYGPVARFVFGDGTPVVSLNQPELLEKTLKIGDRPEGFFKLFERFLKPDNMMIHSADRARNIRKLLATPVRHEHLKHRFEDLLKITSNFVTSFRPTSTLRMQEDGFQFSLLIAINLLAGMDPKPDLKDTLRENWDYVIHMMYTKPLGRTEEEEAKVDAAFAVIDEFIDDLIQRKKEILEKNGPSKNRDEADMLEVLLTSDNPHTDASFTRDQIYGYLVNYVQGSYQTTGTSIGWTVFQLTQHPEVQKKVQDEVEQVLGTPHQADDWQWVYPEITPAHLDKFNYLNRCIKESLRMYNPGLFAARCVTKDFELGEYFLPAGTAFLYPMSALHMNPEVWPEPKKYDPDRFLTDHGLNFIPFGAGPRRCPGEHLSSMVMTVVLAKLIQRFDFKLDMPLERIVPDTFLVAAKNDILVKLNPRYE